MLMALVAVLVVPLRSRTQVPWLHAQQVLAASPLMQLAKARAGDGRAFFAGNWNLMQPRDAMLIGMRCVQDYEPLASRRLQRFLYAVAGTPEPASDAPMPFLGTVPNPNPLAQPRLLDLVSSTLVVVTGPTEAPMRVEGLRQVGQMGTSTIYTNPSALPRAYTVGRARFVPSDDAALDAIVAADFDPRGEVVLVGEPADADRRGGRSGCAERARRRCASCTTAPSGSRSPSSRRCRRCSVLTDAFAPGWEALVDGRPRRLWQANHLVRGVVVQPGDREVAFVYRAPGWRSGWIVFAAGWLAALTVVALARQMK